MTLIIVLLLIFSYLLIATGHLTGVNKAAIAVFLGTVGWVVYVCYGTDYVMDRHAQEYADFLAGASPTSEAVKVFIYQNVFLKYVGEAASIVLFLLATMTIVEILNNNGCFDFVQEWIRTRNSKRLLWTMTAATFIVSANLDNLTTTTMMLVMMHQIVQSRRQRMLIGAAIVLAATCGGCLTVIGDPTNLLLWENGAVTASRFSAYMLLPALLAWIVPSYLIGRELPDHLDVSWPAAPYRGDDTRLNRWQRLLMLFVGIGGLWFIPTFHNITKLSPALGALCVLSVLWVVNEAFNRKLMDADQMAQRRVPRAIQYGSIQQMLYVMGIMLGMGVVVETGVFSDVSAWMDETVGNMWVLGAVSGLLSALVDTFTIAVSNISLYDIGSDDYAVNGTYWKMVAFSTAVGGSLLCVGSTSGLALMKMEHMHTGWYMKNIMPKVLLGWLTGMVTLWIECTYI